MEIKELEKKVADQEKEITTLKQNSTEKDAALETEKASRIEAEKKLKTEANDKRKVELNALADELVTEKHLLPADKDAFVQVICHNESLAEIHTYEIGEKKEKTSFRDVLVGILKKYEVEMNTEEETETGKGGSNKDNQVLMDKANAYALKHKVSFKEALEEVAPDSEKK